MNFNSYLKLEEAFNFRPTKTLEVPKNIKNSSEISKLVKLLQTTFPHHTEHITVDKELGKVKILRALKDEIENNPEIKLEIKSFIDSGIVVRDIFGDGSKQANINSLGQALTNAGELATILSLTKTINSPEDTKQKIFIDNPEAYLRWENTFKETKLKVESIVKNSISDYKIIHDATDKGEFVKVITKFTKKIKTPKDTWNPADIFMVLKKDESSIIKKLNEIVDNNTGNLLISYFNSEIYSLYEKGSLYPISLKQIIKSAKVEYTNIPNSDVKYDKITNYQLNISFDLTTAEVGIYRFKNQETKKYILMQHRGFPRKYSTCQTEITSDGTLTGGRVGKVPTRIIDNIMEEYNYSRIKTMKYFGQNKEGKMLDNFDSKKRKDVIEQFKYLSKSKYSNMDISLKDFKILMYSIDSKTENEIINFCSKVQGLRLCYLFIKNNEDISNILNDMINGAKKINKKAGFFIKIY